MSPLNAAAQLGPPVFAPPAPLESEKAGESKDSIKNSGAPRLYYTPALDAPQTAPLERVALILPLDAPGAAGRAARNFHEGFVHAVRAQQAVLQAEVYPTDGGVAGARAAYFSAVAAGAPLIIGPLQRSVAAAMGEVWRQATTPVILLQPPPTGAAGEVMALSLDSGMEARELADELAGHGFTRAILIYARGGFGERQAAWFSQAWRAGNLSLSRFAISGEGEGGWRRLFNATKEESEEDAQTAAVIAGNAEFVKKARSYLPPRFAAFGGRWINTGEGGVKALHLENLRFAEMPWFARVDSEAVAAYNLPEARRRDYFSQRFFALGIDAARIALAADSWMAVREGWTLDGVTGELRLQDCEAARQATPRRFCHFARRGVMVRRQGGRLREVRW